MTKLGRRTMFRRSASDGGMPGKKHAHASPGASPGDRIKRRRGQSLSRTRNVAPNLPKSLLRAEPRTSPSARGKCSPIRRTAPTLTVSRHAASIALFGNYMAGASSPPTTAMAALCSPKRRRREAAERIRSPAVGRVGRGSMPRPTHASDARIARNDLTMGRRRGG